MTERVRLDSLLFSNDIEVIGVMTKVLKSFYIDMEVYSEITPTLNAIAHRHLDAVLVDWNCSDPTRIIRDARKSSPNYNSTIVAMVDRKSETHALLVGANFMIQKPVNPDKAGRCMRAAYGTMLQQRRRSARVSLDISANVRVADLGTFDARITDVSVGGLALRFEQPLPLGQELSLPVKLPHDNGLIRVVGKVVNASPTGRVGVRFIFIPDDDLNVLEKWLATELAKLDYAELPPEMQGVS